MIGVDKAAGLGRSSRQGDMGKAGGAGLSTSVEEWESGRARLVTVRMTLIAGTDGTIAR